jgi:Initiator Replication protein
MTTHLTLAQRTNFDGFPKPGELIEITGAHELEATDRAILNLLYQHAHDSGRLGERDAEWSVPLSALKTSLHESNDRLKDSLQRILRVAVTVPIPDPQGDEPGYLLTPLFEFLLVPPGGKDRQGQVQFGIPRKLQPILARSNRWGRIKAEVVCAMTSKYAMALYELVQLRANLDRCIETFPVNRFRELLGVRPGAYTNGKDLRLRVIEPALLEVNGLSDVGVDIRLDRRHATAPITAVTIVWWKKQGDEFRAAMQERNRSKVGRMARLRGTAETVASLTPPLS